MRRKGNLTARAASLAPFLRDGGVDTPDSREIKDCTLDLSYLGSVLELEIGCGKGRFAIEYAKSHPEVGLVAVEQITNVIIEGAEKAKAIGIPNLLFLRTGAEYLERYFPQKTFRRIYLNFPCPYHKESYHARRLTARRFLELYDRLLTDDGEICLKTDNERMFEYSIESFSAYGFLLTDFTLDLHASKYAEGNVMTEYESKFVAEGAPILRVVAKKRT